MLLATFLLFGTLIFLTDIIEPIIPIATAGTAVKMNTKGRVLTKLADISFIE